MKTSQDMAVFCDENDILLEYDKLPLNKFISCRYEGENYILIDESEMSEAERKTHLAHEIGHCETGSFYHAYSPLETRERCEYRANLWAIKKLLPKEELERAFQRGCIEVWQLAENFEVTENLIRFACQYYFGKL